ncbi:MAG: HAMP domain-containing histidine kinase [Catenulispora sp.]|nr:HAMP domain-containing histidine kinase [Catenulispora sp.]NUR61000.1 HAMP domain-containing histidine kinase [Catenulispora sp.]
MHLRALRIWFTVAAGFLTALLVVPTAFYIHHTTSVERYSAIEDDAETSAAQLALTGTPGEVEPLDAWWFSGDGQTKSKPTDFHQPPVIDWAVEEAAHDDANKGLFFDDMQPMGRGTIVQATALSKDGSVVLVLRDLRDYHAGLNRLAWWLTAAAAGVVLLVSGAAWVIAGLAQVPAKRALRFQQDFLADAAHELRTPLAVLQASVSHALARPRSEAEYAETLGSARTAVERADRAVSRLLDLARLNSGTVQLIRTPLRLDLLAEEVVETAAAGGVPVEFQGTRSVVVEGDEALLRQVLDNLVRNAAPRASRIVVEVGAGTGGSKREASVTVTDDGPGFETDLLPHVFRRFARGDGRGHGIGLALVESIASLHGGRAAVENRAGGGARVTVALPLGS